MMIGVIALFFMSCLCFVGQVLWSAVYFSQFEKKMIAEIANTASCNTAFRKASRPRFQVLGSFIL